ncbi:uncharacterized protein [Typha angustifolia]|uniref:uncharacterized protein isoform X1 n=1 Tax=Typha angustifolia TaxID=59011 RepID=UPI003C2FF9C4
MDAEVGLTNGDVEQGTVVNGFRDKGESLNTENEGCATIAENDTPNPSKRAVSHSSNNVRRQNDRGVQNVVVADQSQNKRSSLPESLSFPATATSANSSIKTTLSLKQPKPKPKAKSPHSKDSEGPLPTKLSNFTATGSTQCSLSEKSGSHDEIVNDTSYEAEVALSHDVNTKPLRDKLPAKVDDDAHSTTSSITTHLAVVDQKRTSAGFSFRLEKRAEKRKEFLQKLEEKSHAKELERSDLQAKFKENREAEIKQLRKSLTFKAKPMPSFYQEAGPPKVELKKIPPTRARSPKLGRRKPTNSAPENPAQGCISSTFQSACTTANSTNLDESEARTKLHSAALKKVSEKSLSKLPSKKPTAAKSERPLSTKPRVLNIKPKIIKEEQCDDGTVEVVPETVVAVGSDL